MAINSVSFVSPKAEPQRQEKPKKTAMEQILEGLQIANGVLGIGKNVQDIRSGQRDIEAKDYRAKGGLTKPEEADFRDPTKFQPAKEGDEGSFLAGYVRGQDGMDSPLVVKAQTPTQKVAGQYLKTPGPDGKPVYQWAANGGTETPLKAYVEPKDPKQAKDISVQERNTLQNQYDRNPTTRTNAMVLSSYEDAKALVADPSPASDQALIVAYVKAFDPTSVVKETEAETAQAMGSLEQRARAKLAQMTGDGKLTDAQRQDLFKQIQVKAQTAAKRQADIDKQFATLAERRGVSVDDLRLTIPPSFEMATKPQQQGAGEAFAGPADGNAPPAAAVHPQAKAARAWAESNANSPDPKTKAKALEMLKRLGPPEAEAQPAPSSGAPNPLGNRYRGNRG